MAWADAMRMMTVAAPRLYRAARRAGESPRETGAILTGSVAAFVVAARRHPRAWRQQNAVRHFAWQALLTARHGRAVAQALAEAHERGSRDAADTAVDRANNAAGQEYGAAHAAELRHGPLGSTVGSLARVAEAEWAAGRLSGERPRGR